MRKNPENSIFKNYYRFDNGDYFQKYNKNDIGNIINSNGNLNYLNLNTKYTPIYRLLTNIFDFKLNNSHSVINNLQSSHNSNNVEINNKTNEDSKNNKLQEKENSINKNVLIAQLIMIILKSHLIF